MQDIVIINVGTLTSWNSLYRNIAPKLDILRENLQRGNIQNIIWDFSYIQSGRVNMAALTAFLSIAKSVRNNYKLTPKLKLNWDPQMLRFLTDVNFFKIANDLDIFQWDETLIGGMTLKMTNPNSKILYFNDIPNKELLLEDKTKLNNWKETKREELIIEEIYSRVSALFIYETFNEDWKQHLVDLITMTVSELIVNSLLHGQEIAFVGFQKSPRGITVCVCDSGIGFLKSMKKNQKWVNDVKMEKDIDALINASIMTKDEIGIRKVIDDIIDSGGYINLSSVDCELRWENDNWEKANKNFDYVNYKNELQTAKNILGEEADYHFTQNFKNSGFYRNFNSKLKGTRITFEIPSIKSMI